MFPLLEALSLDRFIRIWDTSDVNVAQSGQVWFLISYLTVRGTGLGFSHVQEEIFFSFWVRPIFCPVDHAADTTTKILIWDEFTNIPFQSEHGCNLKLIY